MADQLADIRDTFQVLDDWESRYKYVIELGRSLSPMPEANKVDANLVRGCQSQVWLIAKYEAKSRSLSLLLDSDAHIVRGLIAIVLAAYQHKSPRDICEFDIEGLFQDLNLFSHLSAARGNGLRAMVARIRELARHHRQAGEQ